MHSFQGQGLGIVTTRVRVQVSDLDEDPRQLECRPRLSHVSAKIIMDTDNAKQPDTSGAHSPLMTITLVTANKEVKGTDSANNNCQNRAISR